MAAAPTSTTSPRWPTRSTPTAGWWPCCRAGRCGCRRAAPTGTPSARSASPSRPGSTCATASRRWGTASTRGSWPSCATGSATSSPGRRPHEGTIVAATIGREPMREVSANGVELLNAAELAAWRGMLRVHSAIAHELDAELIAAHGLPLSSYEVLLTVADAPDERMRMSEIADSVLLSRSGVTRLVDRLERDGLVERIPCEDDARGQYALLTPAGREAFDAARATHLAGVRRRFLEQFDADELAGLAAYWERLVPGVTS